MRIFKTLIVFALCAFVNAQFGVPKEAVIDEASVQTEGTDNADQAVTQLTEKDARDIAAIIEAAGEDPETIKLIASMKDENSEELEELKKTPIEEILNGLKQTLDEMKMLDVLFEDQVKALEAMEAENLIPEEHMKKYRADPDLLEQDTRKGLYFRFVSLAVVGGWL